jgi:hypothetical protein
MVAEHVATGLVDGAGLGDDLEVGFVVEQHPQAAPDDRVIVGQDDPNHRRRPLVAILVGLRPPSHAADGTAMQTASPRRSVVSCTKTAG